MCRRLKIDVTFSLSLASKICMRQPLLSYKSFHENRFEHLCFKFSNTWESCENRRILEKSLHISSLKYEKHSESKKFLLAQSLFFFGSSSSSIDWRLPGRCFFLSCLVSFCLEEVFWGWLLPDDCSNKPISLTVVIKKRHRKIFTFQMSNNKIICSSPKSNSKKTNDSRKSCKRRASKLYYVCNKPKVTKANNSSIKKIRTANARGELTDCVV